MALVNVSDSTSDRETTMRLDFGFKHGVLDQKCNLHSELWNRLPECLVAQILAKLPFSSLVRLSSVCKKWKDLIFYSQIFPRCTSRQKYLFFFQEKNLSVFNSIGGIWKTISLLFLTRKFNLEGVVGSSGTGGLLCFFTSVCGEFIVCNPLTKSYKQLRVPFADSQASTLSSSDLAYMPVAPWVHWDLLRNRPYDYRRTSLLTGMVVDSYMGHFKLIVASLFAGSRGTTLVYDSRVNTWKKVAAIPQEVLDCFNNHKEIHTTVAECGRYLYFYPNTLDFDTGDKLLKYDVEHETWSWILMPRYGPGLPLTGILLESFGKVFWVRSSYVIQDDLSKYQPFVFEVLELQDHEGSGPTPWVFTDCLGQAFSRVLEAVTELRDTECLGQGNVLFFIRRHLALNTMGIVSLTGAEIPYSKTPASPCSSHCWEEFDVRTWFTKDETDYSAFANREGNGGHKRLPGGRLFTPSTLLLK